MHRLLKFDWSKCRDGYRVEARPEPTPAPKTPRPRRSPFDPRPQPTAVPTTMESVGGGTFIVPRSANWETYQPLDVPAAYRAFSKWDGSDEGLRKLADA